MTERAKETVVDQRHLKDQVYEACVTLRFAEGLRRRANEARAEATVQEAVAAAWLEGMRVNADAVRTAAMALDTRPGLVRSPLIDRSVQELDLPLAGAMGAWRAMWRVQDLLPPLNARLGPGASTGRPAQVPMLGLLASLNKDACSFLVARGAMAPAVVAMPQRPDVVAQVARIAQGGDLARRRPGNSVVDGSGGGGSGGEAIDRAGEILRLLLTQPVFAFGNVPTAFAAVKWSLATAGVEPTGVCVLTRWGVEAGAGFMAIVREDPTEVVAKSLIRGCAEGQGIVRAVQAGRLPG